MSYEDDERSLTFIIRIQQPFLSHPRHPLSNISSKKIDREQRIARQIFILFSSESSRLLKERYCRFHTNYPNASHIQGVYSFGFHVIQEYGWNIIGWAPLGSCGVLCVLLDHSEYMASITYSLVFWCKKKHQNTREDVIQLGVVTPSRPGGIFFFFFGYFVAAEKDFFVSFSLCLQTSHDLL